MKKFKSILCMALMLIVGCVAFVGCGPKKEEDNPPPANQTTTITLAEAKTTIVNALKIDEPQAQAMAMTYATEQQGNRDIFVKFGKTDFVLDGKMLNENGEILYNMPAHLLADKTNGTWNKYNLESTILSDDGLHNVKTYFNGANHYSKVDEQTPIEEDLFGDFSQMYLTTIDSLFSDDAFEIFYSGDVVKTTINGGYTFTMPVSYLSYSKYLAKQQGNLEQFEEEYRNMSNEQKQQFANQGNVSVVITFDNNNDITNLKMDMAFKIPVGPNLKGSQTMSMTITKHAGEITEPQWVTDFIASQN